ncbi:conserved hypothetical protein [Histoplasma capsulatum var. duboisii H88]|uniref:Uncharacterized protein n=2 Tax=Ajellomyces capsulatus TaxID=5037 RepID=F0UVE7_AJEC8|nr:conserved hypothetical protein [Histoplasma capsulatum H143]EGC49874.1 conserved hypothetical protein [Histoplasma capsulatum var. duboisii H88]
MYTVALPFHTGYGFLKQTPSSSQPKAEATRLVTFWVYERMCAHFALRIKSPTNSTLMPCLISLEPSRKPQEPDDDLAQPQHQSKWLKLTLKHHCQTLAVGPLNSCKPKNLKEIKRLSRRGGPDLSDLGTYVLLLTIGTIRPLITKAPSTTAYNWNFQQHLADHGVYPPGYKYPDGQKPAKPNNWLELNE